MNIFTLMLFTDQCFTKVKANMVIFCKSFIKLLINEKDKLPFFYLFTANLSLEERPNFQPSDKICPTDIKNHIL